MLLHYVQSSSSTLLSSHSRATHSEHHARNLDAWGEPCGGACTPHLPEVSCHYRVVAGQCGPGSIPGQCRSWSRRLQPSKSFRFNNKQSRSYQCFQSAIIIIRIRIHVRTALYLDPDLGGSVNVKQDNKFEITIKFIIEIYR